MRSGRSSSEATLSLSASAPNDVFLPLSHHPGEAQVDFGFANVWLNGEQTKVALFVMTLPYSDAIDVLDDRSGRRAVAVPAEARRLRSCPTA